jgi:hypothetical protein
MKTREELLREIKEIVEYLNENDNNNDYTHLLDGSFSLDKCVVMAEMDVELAGEETWFELMGHENLVEWTCDNATKIEGPMLPVSDELAEYPWEGVVENFGNSGEKDARSRFDLIDFNQLRDRFLQAADRLKELAEKKDVIIGYCTFDDELFQGRIRPTPTEELEFLLDMFQKAKEDIDGDLQDDGQKETTTKLVDGCKETLMMMGEQHGWEKMAEILKRAHQDLSADIWED